MDARREAYTHVHRAYTPKRACTGTWLHVQRRTGRVYTPKMASTGTWMHVQRPTQTCARGTHRKRPVQARVSTSRGIHTPTQGVHTEKGWYRQRCTGACTECSHQNGPLQARGCMSRVTHTRAHGVRTKKGRYRDVDARPEAYTHVHRVYTPKGADTGTWMHVKRLTHT